MACRQLSVAFDSRDAEIARELGISRSELRLLNLLEDGARSQVDAAAHLGLSRSAVTSLVDSLARRGLVERSTPPEDRRVKLLTLTPAVWGALAHHYGPAGGRVLEAIGATADSEASHELARQLSAIAAALRPELANAGARPLGAPV